MRRASVTQIKIAAVGAILWAAAMLLPIPKARAQSPLVPHFDAAGAVQSGSGEVRDAFCGTGTWTESSSAWP